MIELDVEEYCHDCPGFKAVSEVQVLYADDYGKTVCATVKCINNKQCKHIHRYLERKVNENGENK